MLTTGSANWGTLADLQAALEADGTQGFNLAPTRDGWQISIRGRGRDGWVCSVAPTIADAARSLLPNAAPAPDVDDDLTDILG